MYFFITFEGILFRFHRAFLNINYVLHQTNALIYLKNIKILYKMLDKIPQHMFRLIDKPSSGHHHQAVVTPPDDGLWISRNICWGFLSNIL